MTTIKIEMPPEVLQALSELKDEVREIRERLDQREEWMTTEDVARYMRVNADTVRRLAREGKLPVHRPGGKNMRFMRSEVQSSLAAMSSGASS